MKLKEYWPSWRAARAMKNLPLDKLLRPSKSTLPVIVTLTSIPSRLQSLHLTIRSVLNQSSKPEKIVLWLHHDLEDQVPPQLRQLQGECFEIRYVDLNCSHRKLIHALDAYPNKILVTCDDDLIYDQSWLRRLYDTHQTDNKAIIAHVCRRITWGPNGQLMPYKQWPIVRDGAQYHDNLLPIGYGGVLYPPNSLPKQTVDVSLFMSLAPRADDLWFKAMSWLHGTKVRCSISSTPSPQPIIGSQKVSLLKSNVREDGNRLQWQALCEHFNIRMEP